MADAPPMDMSMSAKGLCVVDIANGLQLSNTATMKNDIQGPMAVSQSLKIAMTLK